MKRYLPENHWEYSGTDEFNRARNTLCNMIAEMDFEPKLMSIDDEYLRDLCRKLLHPIRAKNLSCIIEGRDQWPEITGRLKIVVKGYVREGNGSPQNRAKIAHAFFSAEETGALLSTMHYDDQIALTTYAYATRRDLLRWKRDQLKREKNIRFPDLDQRIFWMEGLFNNRVRHILANMS